LADSFIHDFETNGTAPASRGTTSRDIEDTYEALLMELSFSSILDEKLGSLYVELQKISVLAPSA
jgi:hypothetical protein